jgi:hypothetical protein
MKATIAEYDYESAACCLYDYYSDSIYRINGSNDKAYVSTIYKINNDTAYTFRSKSSPVKIDSTRKTNNKNYIVFDQLKVQMHHMNMVRKDLRKKYMSSTYLKHGFKAVESAISCYDRWEYPEQAMSPHGELFSLTKIDRIFNEFPFVTERRNDMLLALSGPSDQLIGLICRSGPARGFLPISARTAVFILMKFPFDSQTRLNRLDLLPHAAT